MIDEAFPTGRPLQKVVHSSLDRGLDRNFSPSQILRFESGFLRLRCHGPAAYLVPLRRMRRAAVRIHSVIAIIRSSASFGHSLRSAVIRHFNGISPTTRVHCCCCHGPQGRSPKCHTKHSSNPYTPRRRRRPRLPIPRNTWKRIIPSCARVNAVSSPHL